MVLQRLALVLNASYEPINIVSARRAITLVMKGAALVEESSAHSIRTARLSGPIPSVVRLLVYRRMPRLNRSVSRKSIMLRDRHPASIAIGCSRRNRSLWITSPHAHEAVGVRGKIWSPPAMSATTGKPIARPRKREWH